MNTPTSSTEITTVELSPEQQQLQIQINHEIEHRNKVFSKATKQQKRILIARDVIKLIKVKKLAAQRGKFVENNEIRNMIRRSHNDDYKLTDEPLQPLFLKPTISCYTCALGAMMVSCTLYNNKEMLSDFASEFEMLSEHIFAFKRKDNTTKPKNGFADFFSEEQLAKIELTFEWRFSNYYQFWVNKGVIGCEVVHNGKEMYNITKTYLDKSLAFAKRYPDHEPRLLAIMRNIIKNKGTFKL